MLDPLTSLGLASNIVQLVDFGLKIISKGQELLTTGTTAEYAHLNLLATELSALCKDLDGAHGNRSTAFQSSASTPLRELVGQAEGVADELATMLQGLQLQQPSDGGTPPTKRRRTAASRLVKGIWKERDVSGLKSRLSDLQQTMVLRVGAQQLTSSSALLAAVEEMTDDQRNDRMRRLAHCVEIPWPVAANSSISTTNDNAQEIYKQRYKEMVEQVKRVDTCHQVLKSLYFERVYDREVNIQESHANTFSWIFDREDLGFTRWATSENGIYWVTGKPGSGKSTLMKYLVHHVRLRELLRAWTGTKKPLIAYHYFWNAGTAMQKSQLGLLRTLWLHVVRQAPEAAVKHAPARFSGQWDPTCEPWTQNELCNAIIAFASEKQCGERLCLFIDGLDEYVGEHSDIMGLISTLAQCSFIKMCVSSRPWNVFVRAFDGRADGQLAVHDLTQRDIERYVRHTMGEDPLYQALQQQDGVGCEKLIKAITRKAQGVFLWVRLVTRSLLRGLNNDDDLRTLNLRVREYPDTLDAYYQRMFDRIERVYRRQSARIILCALFAAGGIHDEGRASYSFNSADGYLPSWLPHCLELEIARPGFAGDLAAYVDMSALQQKRRCRCAVGNRIDGRCLPCWTDLLHHWHRDESLAKEKIYLDARCADFLEPSMGAMASSTLQSDGGSFMVWSTNGIDFIHRTARDFLEHDVYSTLWSRARNGMQEYDIGLSLAGAFVAGIKAETEDRQVLLKRLIKIGCVVKAERLDDYLVLLHALQSDRKRCGIQKLTWVVQDGRLRAQSKVGGEVYDHIPVKLQQMDPSKDFGLART